jgi:hypothetical protein
MVTMELSIDLVAGGSHVRDMSIAGRPEMPSMPARRISGYTAA